MHLILGDKILPQARHRADIQKLLKLPGCFETVKLRDAKPLFFKDHYERLQKSCQMLGIPMQCKFEHARENALKLMNRNALKNGYLRVSVHQHHSQIQQLMLAGPPRELSKRSSARLCIASQTHPGRTLRTKVKHNHRPEHQLAFEEAKTKQVDEALLLNAEGRIIEGARTNIFFIKNQKLHTAPVPEGALNGIIRAKILKLAEKLDIAIQEKSLELHQIESIEESFITNALIHILPVQSIGAKSFSIDKKQNCTTMLAEELKKLSSKG